MIKISGTTGIDMGNTPVSNASQIDGDVVNENGVNVATINNLVGFKNYIINGKKQINQRGLTSTDNSYNQDRWYKAGNNWYQGIEGINLTSGMKYTLSWVGVATASYYVGTATSATINAQTFIPISNGGSFTLTITAGQNLWVKFASDATGSTFNFVQLEEGSIATPFENRPYGLELSLCQRYLPCFSGTGYAINTSGASISTDKTYTFTIRFITPTRISPTGVVVSSISHFNIGETVTTDEPAVSLVFGSSGIYGANLTATGTTTTSGKIGRPVSFKCNDVNGKIYFTGCEL